MYSYEVFIYYFYLKIYKWELKIWYSSIFSFKHLVLVTSLVLFTKSHVLLGIILIK